jgi:MFS family permease
MRRQAPRRDRHRVRADPDFRFVTALLTTAFIEQVTISIMRVTTSYRAVELGLSAVWLGVITAAFAILPIVFALRVGRFIDRGNDARTAWFGTGLIIVACGGFAVSPSLAILLMFTSVLGIGHMLVTITLQVLCTRRGGAGTVDRMLGNYMVANAVGQGVGPYIVGWAGGSASIPPTEFLFLIGLGTSVLAFAIALMLRSSTPPTARSKGSKPIAVREILQMPGLIIVLFVSVTTVVAQDLIVVYLPLLGAERAMPVDAVGMLLAVRAVSSMLSRFLYARLIDLMGRRPLMLVSVFASAVSYAALALPLPLPAMHAVMAAAGFSLGVSITVTIASLLVLATEQAVGTANSLRIMGNRIGQFVIPFLAGLIAAVTGVGGIFLIIGLSLAASGAAVQFGRQRA